ncbi:hypothetical protein BDQ17DRAFT_544867 [Cyathus striatus]|nr:hypothetical protein BDQ17DRAFT_544867 [Cyathus striatus]
MEALSFLTVFSAVVGSVGVAACVVEALFFLRRGVYTCIPAGRGNRTYFELFVPTLKMEALSFLTVVSAVVGTVGGVAVCVVGDLVFLWNGVRRASGRKEVTEHTLNTL